MKRKIFLLAIVVICLATAVSGTIAYFTSEDTAHNVITSGGVEIKVVEKTLNEGNVLVDFPKEGIKNVMPGKAISKIVQVKNTGNAEAWIRIKVESEMKNPAGDKLPLVLANGKSIMSYSVLDGWSLGDDGFYYYEKPVSINEFTDELFKEVKFEPLMGNEYQNCTANIIINAQAVQTANNPIPEDGSVKDIKGWPSSSEGENSVND